MKITRLEREPLAECALAIEIPSHAAGCEIAAPDVLVNPWKTRRSFRAGEIQILARTIRDMTAAVKEPLKNVEL